MSEPIIEMANPNSGENVEIETEIQANDAVSAAKAEAYAVGERNGVPVTAGDSAYHNNSKYYAQQAGNESDEAEAWAKGTKDGTDVPTTDPAYHNNAKYFRDMAQQDANAAAGSATEAAGSADRGGRSSAGSHRHSGGGAGTWDRVHDAGRGVLRSERL